MNFEVLVTAAAILGRQVEELRNAVLDAEVRAEDEREIANLRATLDMMKARHQQVEAAILG